MWFPEYDSGDEDRIQMAAYFGTISEISISQELRTAFVERLVQYLAANKIKEPDQQQAVLFSFCGLQPIS